jgi:hypothetical protein
MDSLLTGKGRIYVHMSGRSLAIKLNNSTELLVHLADGDCQWSLRTIKYVQDSNG